MISKRPGDRYASWDEVINRLHAGSLTLSADRDVNSLVERALEGQRKAELARLDAERKEVAIREYRGLVEYSFGEIVQAAREIVDAFNRASDFAKLKMSPTTPISGWSLGFIVFAEGVGVRQGEVIVFVVPVYEDYKLDSQGIRAWGFVKAPSRKGFNLVLVSEGSDDLYGKWKTLHVEHSPLLRKPTDGRLEPFPFELNELPNEIQLLRALHIYQTTQGEFRPEMLEPLIGELLTSSQ